MADGTFPRLLARKRDAVPQDLRRRDRRRAVRVTVSNASIAPARLRGREDIQSSGEIPLLISLQVQRRAIGDAIYGWRKPRSSAAIVSARCRFSVICSASV